MDFESEIMEDKDLKKSSILENSWGSSTIWEILKSLRKGKTPEAAPNCSVVVSKKPSEMKREKDELLKMRLKGRAPIKSQKKVVLMYALKLFQVEGEGLLSLLVLSSQIK